MTFGTTKEKAVVLSLCLLRDSAEWKAESTTIHVQSPVINNEYIVTDVRTYN